jgi:hypothetical protein
VPGGTGVARERGDDMHAVLTKVLAVAAGATLLVGLATAPAAAAPPDTRGAHLEHVLWEDQSTWSSADDPEWPCDLGFDVVVTRDLRGLFKVQPRGRDGQVYFHSTVRGTVSFSANGHTYSNTFAIVDKDHSVALHPDDPDRLLISVLSAGGGAWYADGERVARDPGLFRFEFSIDHNGTLDDPYDDPDESWEFERVILGSTGLNETEGRDFCEDLALYLAPDED